MAGELGALGLKLYADTAEFTSDIGRAATLFDKNMAKMEHGILAVRNALVAAVGLGGFGAIIKGAIDTGDQLNKLSQKVGISVERLSELKLGADLADASFEDFTRGLKEFNKSLAEAADPNSKSANIFKALGVDPTQDPAEALRRFADAFSQLQDKMKVPIADAIMGKSGTQLIPWLNAGADGMDRMAEKARKFGLVISAEFAKQSEQFNHNLNLLSKNTEALGIKAGGGLIGGLTTLTGRLVEATEKGKGFTGFLRESLFLMTALAELAFLPRGVGQAMFNLLEGNWGSKGRGLTPEQYKDMMAQHAARWGQGGGGAPFVGPPVLNQDAVACAASGGKWKNGRCVRPGDEEKAKAAREKALREYVQMSEQITRMEDEHGKEIAEAWSFVPAMLEKTKAREGWENMFPDEITINKTNAAIQVYHDQLLAGIDFTQEYEVRVRQLQAGFDGLGNALKTDDSLARDLGLTFQSAFEDAAVAGKKLSDVLRGLAQDIARIVFRKTVTEPLGGAISTLLQPVTAGMTGFFRDIFNPRMPGVAAGGAVSPFGGPRLVGEHGPEMFVPQGFGQIVPNHALAGAGGTLNITFQVNALDPRTAASVIVENRRTIEGVVEAAYARAGRTSGMKRS